MQLMTAPTRRRRSTNVMSTARLVVWADRTPPARSFELPTLLHGLDPLGNWWRHTVAEHIPPALNMAQKSGSFANRQVTPHVVAV